jgi:zinc transporter, ZIP family
VPEADREAGAALTAAGLLAGTLVYVGADAWLNRDEGMRAMRRSGHAAAAGRPMSMPSNRAEVARGESIAAGLFVDGVPESIALGLTIAEGEVGLALLVGIVVGNVVEAYGAAQPILVGGQSRRFALTLLGLIGVALALATVLGGTVLADASPELIGTAQAVAAGAVLAVVSIAIIPHAFEEVSSAVAAATVLGFVGGYLLS